MQEAALLCAGNRTTRSAPVRPGGIGPKPVDAIRTGHDREGTFHIIVVILVHVPSGRLSLRLIRT